MYIIPSPARLHLSAVGRFPGAVGRSLSELHMISLCLFLVCIMCACLHAVCVVQNQVVHLDYLFISHDEGFLGSSLVGGLVLSLPSLLLLPLASSAFCWCAGWLVRLCQRDLRKPSFLWASGSFSSWGLLRC